MNVSRGTPLHCTPMWTTWRSHQGINRLYTRYPSLVRAYIACSVTFNNPRMASLPGHNFTVDRGLSSCRMHGRTFRTVDQPLESPTKKQKACTVDELHRVHAETRKMCRHHESCRSMTEHSSSDPAQGHLAVDFLVASWTKGTIVDACTFLHQSEPPAY